MSSPDIFGLAAEFSPPARQVLANGFVRLEGGLPADKTEQIRKAVERRLDAYRAENPANRGRERYYMHLPIEPPFDDPAIYRDADVMSVVEELLGPDVYIAVYGTDTPLPGSEYQLTHVDQMPLFPKYSAAHPPFLLIATLNLVDIDEENGPMEIWPRSHLTPWLMDLGELADEAAPLKVTGRAGAFSLRDARAWHRGTPAVERARPTISICYARAWYRHHDRPLRIAPDRAAGFGPEDERLFRFHESIVGNPAGQACEQP